jgi:hypothetical protein
MLLQSANRNIGDLTYSQEDEDYENLSFTPPEDAPKFASRVRIVKNIVRPEETLLLPSTK